MKLHESRFLVTAALLALLAGCGGDKEEAGGQAAAPAADNAAEVEEYYRSKVKIPVEVWEQLENGEIPQEEVDRRKCGGRAPEVLPLRQPRGPAGRPRLGRRHGPAGNRLAGKGRKESRPEHKDPSQVPCPWRES